MVSWCLAWGVPKPRSRPQSSCKPAGTHQCSLIPVLIALWEIWAGLGGGERDWKTVEGLPAGLRRTGEEWVWMRLQGRRRSRCALELASQRGASAGALLGAAAQHSRLGRG